MDANMLDSPENKSRDNQKNVITEKMVHGFEKNVLRNNCNSVD